MLGRLNHVAIAVPDLDEAARLYRERLGAKVSEPRALPEHGVTVVFVDLPNTRIELMQPLGTTSPIAGFLTRNPSGGMHHLCFEVTDIRAARDQLTEVARAFPATGNQGSARMANPCSSCIRRISPAL
jgi:methylmalonyl-CoA/ethylmalonyl-CoA epimerase